MIFFFFQNGKLSAPVFLYVDAKKWIFRKNSEFDFELIPCIIPVTNRAKKLLKDSVELGSSTKK